MSAPNALGSTIEADSPAFPRPLSAYHDQEVHSLVTKLMHRAAVEPFNIVSTLIFLCAIVHTFLTSRFTRVSHHFERKLAELPDEPDSPASHLLQLHDRLQFRAHFWAFMGEVEAVFGIWLIPLFVAIILMKGWSSLVDYSASINPSEPIFVVAIMAMAGSRPVLKAAEQTLAGIAGIGGQTTAAWWLTILTIGPLLGSFITEPGAMTICALLLREKFYALGPSKKLRYSTLGLLFVGVSVGGTLSHFAAPPVVMVASKWNWGFLHMLSNFGWKAALGVLISNLIYFFFFRRELLLLKSSDLSAKPPDPPIPKRVTFIHLAFIAWTVMTAHYSLLVVLGFLFYLAFRQATGRHQANSSVRSPLLVGFFLVGLILHGTFQQWWLAPTLGSLGEWPLMISATILTGFNDNAAITYLASLVPNFSNSLKYAVMAGAVTGGGLTVIANAPNPVGQSILQAEFGENGIAPLGLFVAAIFPTIVVGACFMLLK